MKRSEAMEGGKKGREEEGWARGCDCRQNLCVVTCSSVPMRLGKSLLQRSAIRTPTSNPEKSASDSEGKSLAATISTYFLEDALVRPGFCGRSGDYGGAALELNEGGEQQLETGVRHFCSCNQSNDAINIIEGKHS